MAAFVVNGTPVTVEKNQKLIRYLRDELHLTSVKDGCVRHVPCPHRRQADESLHPSDRQAGGETYRHGRGPFRL